MARWAPPRTPEGINLCHGGGGTPPPKDGRPLGHHGGKLPWPSGGLFSHSKNVRGLHFGIFPRVPLYHPRHPQKPLYITHKPYRALPNPYSLLLAAENFG